MAYLNGTGSFVDRQHHPIPALVLLDLKMPRANGIEMLEWIRRHPSYHELPVIILSGSELQDDMRRAYAAGANSYFVKPLKFESLVAVIKNISAMWLESVPQPTAPPLVISPPTTGPSGFLSTLQ